MQDLFSIENYIPVKEAKSSSEEVLTVKELNLLAKNTLERTLPICWIRGEISGVKTYSHVYFDLKDAEAKISCVLFSRILSQIDFKLENGLEIEVRGKITIYPANGSYQINVERVRKVGLGELWEAYHRLLNKLKLAGLFEAKFKKLIPAYPKSVGVITSKEGSVIRDVISTLKRRMPSLPIIIYHSAVQGRDASLQLAQAIRIANIRSEVDVLIICRGGGSQEDLWSFNEEIVAQEVFKSNIPIISGVGHETDTTIIDYVADLRAPTPTAAAELVSISQDEIKDSLRNYYLQLNNQVLGLIDFYLKQIEVLGLKLKALNPLWQLREINYKLEGLTKKLNTVMQAKLESMHWNLKVFFNQLALQKYDLEHYNSLIKQLAARLNINYRNLLQTKTQNLTLATERLNLASPNNILAKGYAIIEKEDKRLATSSLDLHQDEKIKISFCDGIINAQVISLGE